MKSLDLILELCLLLFKDDLVILHYNVYIFFQHRNKI